MFIPFSSRQATQMPKRYNAKRGCFLEEGETMLRDEGIAKPD